VKTLWKIFLLIVLGQCFSLNVSSQEDWSSFENAEFKEIFVENLYAFKSLLNPDESITSLEGKEFQITGYYIPVATKDQSIILSKTPFSSCFFCGNAGQETVIDVRLLKPTKQNYVADHKITVRGILRINTEDWETLSFILEESEIVRD